MSLMVFRNSKTLKLLLDQNQIVIYNQEFTNSLIWPNQKLCSKILIRYV